MTGVVNTLLTVGPRLYVGGNFTSVAGLFVRGLAQYTPLDGWVQGTWRAVAKGVQGPSGSPGAVYGLAHVGGCVYVGGAFAAVDNGLATGATAGYNLARTCVGAAGEPGPLEAAGDPALGVVYALVSAAPPQDAVFLDQPHWANCSYALAQPLLPRA